MDFLIDLAGWLAGRFHPSCMGMTIEQAKKLDQFLCSDCSAEDDSKRSQPSFPVSPPSEPKVSTIELHRRVLGDQNRTPPLPANLPSAGFSSKLSAIVRRSFDLEARLALTTRACPRNPAGRAEASEEMNPAEEADGGDWKNVPSRVFIIAVGDKETVYSCREGRLCIAQTGNFFRIQKDVFYCW